MLLWRPRPFCAGSARVWGQRVDASPSEKDWEGGTHGSRGVGSCRGLRAARLCQTTRLRAHWTTLRLMDLDWRGYGFERQEGAPGVALGGGGHEGICIGRHAGH